MIPTLGKREMQCLRLMAQGNSNKQIGAALYLSEFTVKTYVGRLFRRLGARDRAHAVSLGYQMRILPLVAA